jgi:transposase InsO family protein
MEVLEREQTGSKSRSVLIQAEHMNPLYVMQVKITLHVCLLSKMDDVAWLWHARYGHVNFRALRELGTWEMVEGMPVVKAIEQVCDGCALGKQHRMTFLRTLAYRASNFLELVHADLCGHVTQPTAGGKLYFLLIADDYSHYMWLELMAMKGEALRHFKRFKAAAELELGCKLKAFRSCRVGEFNSGTYMEFCQEYGIKHNTTTAYTPQQNGVVERRNQMVVEMARCFLKSMGVPARFWGEAVKTAVYLLNHARTKSLSDKTPFETSFGRKPAVKHLRTFRCKTYVKRVGRGISKLSNRSVPGLPRL